MMSWIRLCGFFNNRDEQYRVLLPFVRLSSR
jgi:hypothetical protein